jgi:NAD(P)-dependent dehydrogenase (short-subunit alcohol dehydrogenase family)
MPTRYHNLVAWVTGGGSGIGRALALRLAREGAAVVVSGRRTEPLEDTADAIRALGGRAAAVPCDVTDDDSVASAVAAIIDQFGQLDVVVANAGFSVGGRLHKMSVDDWKRQFEINLFGVVRTVDHALPHLHKTGGRIALMGSVAQYLPVPGTGPYSASKAAVHTYGQVLSAELGKTPVSCTTIHPGFIESQISQVDNSGTYHSDRTDKRPASLMWKADDAAKPMVTAIWRRRRVAVITGHGKVAAFVGTHFPGLVSTLVSRFG